MAETTAMYEASRALTKLQSLPELLQDAVNGAADALQANRIALEITIIDNGVQKVQGGDC